MGTSTATHEGTIGAAPSSMGTGYGTFAYSSTPNSNSTDCDLSATQFKNGSTSARCNNTTTNANHVCTTVQATSYVRGYYYLTAAPSASFALASTFGGGYAQAQRIGFTSDRKLWIAHRVTSYHTSPSATGGYTASGTANEVPLNEWVRIEGKFTSTTTEIRMWKTTGGSGVDATGTADVTIASGAQTAMSAYDQIGLGSGGHNGSGFAAFMGASQYLYMDDLAVSDVDWIGPSAAPAGTSYAGIVRL